VGAWWGFGGDGGSCLKLSLGDKAGTGPRGNHTTIPFMAIPCADQRIVYKNKKVPQRTENRCSNENSYTNAHSSIIANGRLGKPPVPTIRRPHEQKAARPPVPLKGVKV
jgi:hypothetical protein